MGLMNDEAFSDHSIPLRQHRDRSNSRAHERIPGHFHVKLHVDGTVYCCVTHNISYSGMFIETGRAFLTGQKISLVVHMSDPVVNLHVEGLIMRNSPHGIGVMLLRD